MTAAKGARAASAHVDDEGWTPVSGLDPKLVEWEIPDLDLLAEFAHPVRSRMLRELDHPTTVAEVASQLDVPVTRLYHHVNRLESLGLIRVVATRRSGAATERRYETVAMSFRVAEGLRESSDPHELAGALGALFDVAKLGFQRNVERRPAADAPESTEGFLSLVDMKLSPQGCAELMARLRAVVDDFGRRDDTDDDAAVVSLFIAAAVDTA